MASKIKAITTYCPRLKLQKTTPMLEIVEFIAARTGLTRGGISVVLNEIQDTIFHFNRAGRPVKFDGLGMFTPVIDLNGVKKVVHRPDKMLRSRLNADEMYTGDILNRDNIGKTSAELVTMWNEEFPEDPVV